MNEKTTMPMRVAVYARVSSDEQREGKTIDSQVEELRRFARERGWTVVREFKDDGWSGALMARPALDQLRDLASRNTFEAVLINDVDRLARNVSHLGVIKRDFERRGVEVIFRKIPSEKSPTQNLMINVLGSFAEFERELIADRTRRGKRHKVEVRKEFLGTIPAYGFRYIPKNRASGQGGVLSLEPSEAKVVKQMFSWVADQGLSARRVVDRLNEKGVPPRKGGRSWQKSSVVRILRSETYAGTWHYNKFKRCEPAQTATSRQYSRTAKTSLQLRPREQWIALELPRELRIVDRRKWRQVQRQLDRNIAFSRRNSKHNYLLRGLIRCGGCQAAYVGDPNHGRFYYRCSRRCKTYPTVREERLNETVWEAVKQAVKNPDLILKQARWFKEQEQSNERSKADDRRKAKQTLNTLDQQESRILDAYREGLIDPTQLGHQLEKIRSERQALKMQTAERENAPSFQELEKSVKEYCREAVRRLHSFSVEQKQRFLRELLIRVTYKGSQVSIRGRVPLPDRSAPAHSAPEVTPSPSHSSFGRIGAMAIEDRGHNSVPRTDRIAAMAMHLKGRNPSLEFGLVKQL